MPSKKGDAKPNGWASQSATTAGGRLRRHWRTALTVLVVLVVAGAWWDSTEDAASSTLPVAQAAVPHPFGPGRLGGTSADATPQQRAERITELTNQLVLAEKTFCSYRDGTKYPQESRPIAEHPDQIYPNQPVVETHAMRTSSDQGDQNVQINTSQSHVFVASGESVVFSVKAVDREGKMLPLFVTRAVASAITAQGSRIGTQVTLPFADDGSNGDVAVGDGTFSGLLAPAATGFASFNGTIRTEVKYNVGNRSGSVLFDIIHTAEIPATWAGPVREAVEDGSLNLYLKADVRQAGRYLVNGRVDDAKGKPFALVTFNEVLARGPAEIKLTVFGKLMLDQKPVLPLTLRDVEGYLLKENVDPDRALMPRLVGAVHATKTYAPNSFSDSEWQSEQRSRYLTELDKDVKLAKEALVQFNPAQASQSSFQTDCANVGGVE